MSASESGHGKLDEDRFEIDYEEFTEERVRTDGPVSLRQLKQELKNEKRYDDFTDPEDVFLDDFSDLEDAFYELRERNRDDELDGEIAASSHAGKLNLRIMDDQELLRYQVDTEPYMG